MTALPKHTAITLAELRPRVGTSLSSAVGVPIAVCRDVAILICRWARTSTEARQCCIAFYDSRFHFRAVGGIHIPGRHHGM